MSSSRKFYRSVIQVEVVSDQPMEFEDVLDIDQEIHYGRCDGEMKKLSMNEEIDGARMASILLAMGRGKNMLRFFNLTDDGEDMNEQEQ